MSWKTALGVAAVAGIVLCASCGDDPNGDPGNGGADAGTQGDGPLGATDGPSTSTPEGPPGITPLNSHPRLLVRAADLDRLRSWAVPSNPVFAKGLDVLAKSCAKKMDAGEVFEKDPGSSTEYAENPTEAFAELFAFMSLVSPSQEVRDGYAARARKLLMSAIDEAAKGVKDDERFRDHTFALSDRSRWHGEGFMLTVDWIYGSLSAADKATIRTVFLRWADEITHAETTTANHPEPIGLLNDPKLTSNREDVRWATNNYYAGHIRNLGLMALALDVADDPDEKLRSYLASVTGAWLYVFDALLSGDMAGGLGAEGFEYGPQSISYVAQLLAALYSSGRADPAIQGKQATFANAYWDAVVPAYLHSLSSVAAVPKDPVYAYFGPTYSIAAFGDSDKTYPSDSMAVWGAIGIHDHLADNKARLGQLRWIAKNVSPGGANGLLERASDANFFLQTIFYFTLFDPAAASPEDPRPALPLSHVAKGLGRTLARTSWTAEGTWLTHKLSWYSIDHQHADGNMFELYRKGEWLTRERTGYGVQIACTDYKNSLAIENDVPAHNEDYRKITHERGSQWLYVGGDDIKLTTSLTDKFVSILGDSTALYNSTSESSTDITHASRSLVWLKPDRVIVYDRAVTKTDNRFKRFWLNLPENATTVGNLTTMNTDGGQKFFVRTLLPKSANISVEPVEPLPSQPAEYDRISHRLRVELASNPKSVRFLHLLQGADGGSTADSPTIVSSTGATAFEGAAVNNVVVLFPVVLGPLDSLAYAAPGGTQAHVITGLTPGGAYTVVVAGSNVTVTPNGDKTADSGGVLVIGQLP
jgi:hypothetical protein